MTQEEVKKLLEKIGADGFVESDDFSTDEIETSDDGTIMLSSLLSTGADITVNQLSGYFSYSSYSESGNLEYENTAILGYLWSNLFFVRICVDYARMLSDKKIEVSDVKSLTLEISVSNSGLQYPVYLYKSDSTYIGSIDSSTSSINLSLDTTVSGIIEFYIFPNNNETGLSSVEVSGSLVYTDPLSEIRITTPPTKTTYVYGEKFSTAGMVVRAYKNDGTSKVVTDYTYTPTRSLTTSDTNMTISYGTKSVNQAINVIVVPVDKKVTMHYGGTQNRSVVFENASFPSTMIKR